MTVAFDAFSTPTAGTGTLSWTHTPVGTPRAVLVFAGDYDNVGDNVTAATYGGVSLTELVAPLHVDAAKDSRVHAFFLGSSIPTGAQTVEVTVSDSTVKDAWAVTITAAADTEAQDVQTLHSTGSGDRTGTLLLAGNTCFCCEGFMSDRGNPAVTSPLTGWTSQDEHDFGDHVGGLYTYDTVGSDDVTFGANLGVTGVIGVIGVAVTESGAAPADAVGSGLTTGLKLERRKLVA